MLCLVIALAATGCASERTPPAANGGSGASTDSADEGDKAAGQGYGSKEGKKKQEKSQSSDTKVLRVTVNGNNVRGPQDPSVGVGESVELVVTANSSDEVHVHGYDLSKAVKPGKPARLRFVADITGVFEVELERSGTALFELTVQ